MYISSFMNILLQIDVFGSYHDETSFRTPTVPGNGLNPAWCETYTTLVGRSLLRLVDHDPFLKPSPFMYQATQSLSLFSLRFRMDSPGR